MDKEELLARLEDLEREEDEEGISASVAEAVQTLIDCCRFLLNQSTRKNKKKVDM